MYAFFSLNLEKFTPDRYLLHRHVCGVCDKYEVCLSTFQNISKVKKTEWVYILYPKWLSSRAPIFFLLLRIQEKRPVLEIQLDFQQKLFRIGPKTPGSILHTYYMIFRNSKCLALTFSSRQFHSIPLFVIVTDQF